MYTDDQIQALILCEKKVVDAPRIVQPSRGSTKKEFTMVSADGLISFKGYLSQNQQFAENFSIGLVFEDKQNRDRICLLRCNGQHGGVKDIPHHNFSHVHTVLATDLNAGIKIERKIEIIEDYTTYEDAIQYYLDRINLNKADRIKHFPKQSNNYIQKGFFDNEEDPDPF